MRLAIKLAVLATAVAAPVAIAAPAQAYCASPTLSWNQSSLEMRAGSTVPSS